MSAAVGQSQGPATLPALQQPRLELRALRLSTLPITGNAIIRVNGLTVVKCLGSTEVARDWPLLPSLGSSKAYDFSVSECCLPTQTGYWMAGLQAYVWLHHL